MSRMEDAGPIVGRYDHEVVDGQMIRQRIYRVNGCDGGRADCRDDSSNVASSELALHEIGPHPKVVVRRDDSRF